MISYYIKIILKLYTSSVYKKNIYISTIFSGTEEK